MYSKCIMTDQKPLSFGIPKAEPFSSAPQPLLTRSAKRISDDPAISPRGRSVSFNLRSLHFALCTRNSALIGTGAPAKQIILSATLSHALFLFGSRTGPRIPPYFSDPTFLTLPHPR